MFQYDCAYLGCLSCRRGSSDKTLVLNNQNTFFSDIFGPIFGQQKQQKQSTDRVVLLTLIIPTRESAVRGSFRYTATQKTGGHSLSILYNKIIILTKYFFHLEYKATSKLF